MPVKEVYERTTIRSIPVDDTQVPLTYPSDPFGIDDRCTNEAGHYPISSCGAVVCVHCARVFWQ